MRQWTPHTHRPSTLSNLSSFADKAAALVLITFAIAATYIPVRCAAKVDPLVELRYE